MAKKEGARVSEQNQIRRLEKEGLTAEEISDQLRIQLSTVKSFMVSEDELEDEPEPEED